MSDYSFQLETNEFMPLKEVVYNTLKKAILTGELKTGQRLMEIHLASLLGVSRTPVREALHILTEEGLVNLVPKKGALVAAISSKDMTDALNVRMTLEIMAVSIACKNANSGIIEKLNECNNSLAVAAESCNAQEIAGCDMEFHKYIYLATENRTLINMLAKLHEQTFRYRLEYINSIRDFSSIIKEHSLIIEKLSAHDEQGAVELITRHINNQIDGINKII